MNVITYRKSYFILTLLLLVIEVLIALYVHDKIIRPYVGDFLVILLIYCFVQSFVNAGVWKAALGTLLFACLIEFLQYLNLVKILGLQHSRLANTILGNYFEWMDIVAYISGAAVVILVELLIEKRKSQKLTAH